MLGKSQTEEFEWGRKRMKVTCFSARNISYDQRGSLTITRFFILSTGHCLTTRWEVDEWLETEHCSPVSILTTDDF